MLRYMLRLCALCGIIISIKYLYHCLHAADRRQDTLKYLAPYLAPGATADMVGGI